MHSRILCLPADGSHTCLSAQGGLERRKDGLWVHYRLASMPDPVAQTVIDAVNHALGHIDASAKDRRRLLKMGDVAAIAPQPRVRCC